jgi:WD40 repeat protein/predicted Ser/Thr protein kinase
MADQPTAHGESAPIDESDRERRLGEVLAAYFAAVEAGTGPTPEELVAQHPELARDLEGYFADQERFGRLVAPLRPVAQAARAEAATLAGAEATMPPSQFQRTEPPATRSLVEGQGLIPDRVADTVDAPEDPGPGDGGDADADLPRGTRLRYFGDYELRSVLGKGGMGVVYQARQVSLNRPVALKMIKAGVLAGDDELRRFQNEAEAVALLDHPGIVPVYEIGEHEGQKYFSMKLVLGGSLAERLATYKGDPKAVASLLAEVADAVHHAHMRGILHRDLKPANILIDAEGHGHITDFGLAKRVEADAEMTASGAVLGTPAYMAPEQASGRRGAITTATDVHGLGSVLYALLTGQAPFAGDSVVDTLTKVKEQPPEPPRKLNARVPRDLEVICLKCLEKDPRRRYATTQAMADDLRAWLETRPIVARPAGPLEKAVKWARRRPAIAALSALVVLISLIGMAGILSQWREAVVARRAAVEEAQAEARARAEATRLATDLQGQTYSLALALAQREWEAANMAQVQRLLDLCAPRLRRWEWDRLRYLCHLDERTIPAPGIHAAGTFLCWSADGARLASLRSTEEKPAGGWRNDDYHINAQIIDLPHEDRRAVLVPQVRKAAWDPQGHQLLVYKQDETLARVEPAAGTVTRLWSLPVEKLGVWDVAWSPDGRRVAATRSTGTGSNLRVWDAGTGQEERVLAGHQAQVYAVAWSADSKRLASASEDRTVRVWNPDTGASVLTLTGHAGVVKAVAWSPDGSRLATGSQDQAARIWDARTGRTIAVLDGHGGTVTAVAWRPDGSSVATSSDDRTVRLWDTDTGNPLAILRGHADRVFKLAWKPDGSRLASISDDQTIKIWDPFHAGGSLDLIGHRDEVMAVAWSPDNRLVATAAADSVVTLWDAATARPIRNFEGHTEHVYALSFSPDGKRLATASADRTARVWNVATGASAATFAKPKGHVTAVAWSPDSQLVATGDRGMLRIWDPSTGTERLSVQATSSPDVGSIFGVAWSPDGSRIALALALPDQVVLVMDSSTGRTLLKLSGHTHAVSAVAWSPDARFLASSSYDKTSRVWDATTGAPRATLIGHGGFVFSVTWNPDGTRLATAGGDGAIKVWDPSDGNEVLTLAGHNGSIWSVAWSPDGATLASAGADRRVRIWTSRAPAAR